MVEITLYQLEGCPYCELVRQKLDKKKLEYETIEVSRDRNDPLRQELYQKSGMRTVPVIKINDFYLGESTEILKYLEKLGCS